MTKTPHLPRPQRSAIAWLILCCASFFVVTPTVVAAPITIPSGLAAGASYRLVFVTTTSRNGLSTNVADYNAFVTDAANSEPTLFGLGTTWSAIVGTSTVTPRSNTNTDPTVGTGAPIYTVRGDLIAASNAALWDGAIDHTIDGYENGDLVVAGTVFPYTGSQTNGLPALPNALGQSSPYYGSTASSDASWVHTGTGSQLQPGHFYALSGILVAPISVTRPGDYNNNTSVDAADYVVWRKRFGQSVTLPNDITPGTVSPNDYTVWRSNFGSHAGSGVSDTTAVPEPTTVLLLFSAVLAALHRHRKT